MTTRAYRDWVNAGRPFTAAQPIADLTRTLRGYGYTVYTIGNEDHMRADPPEDHTPFSATGWPVWSPRWFGHALDIMPADSLPDLADLGAQLALDRNNGVGGASTIKYMNWTPRGGNCRHESWEPGHSVTGSNDAGHIHLSIRSDCTHSGAMAGYDPVARLRGGGGQGGGGGTPGVTAPPWPGIYLQISRPMMHNDAALQWQQRMHERGWTISVDGWYGPQSAEVCRQFQANHNLEADSIVGPITWRASWELPVT